MRRLVVQLLAVGFVLAFPVLASAHDVLEKTTPADGTTVQLMPDRVSLQFTEPPLALGAQVIVKGPSGEVSSGPASIEGNAVVQAVAADAPAGDYTVTYRVTADDGHPVSGTFSFRATTGLDNSTATAAPTPTTTPSPQAGGESSSAAAEPQIAPIVLSVVGVLVLVALGAFVVLRGREQP